MPRLWVLGVSIAAPPSPIAAIATRIAPQLGTCASLVVPTAPDRRTFGLDRHGFRADSCSDCADRSCSRVDRHAERLQWWLCSPRSAPLAPQSARPPPRSSHRSRRSPQVARQNPRIVGRSPVRAGLSSLEPRRSPQGPPRSPLSPQPSETRRNQSSRARRVVAQRAVQDLREVAPPTRAPQICR